MKHVGPTYRLSYDALDQQISFEGTLRITDADDAAAVLAYLIAIHGQIQGTLRLSFRRLRYINAEGMRALSQFVAFARDRATVNLKIIASGVLAWSVRFLPNLRALWDGVEFIVHDDGFYGSQAIIEDLDFVPLLRNQTRILWPQERAVIQRHGLARGMRVADICCGCGDVPLLAMRELGPSFILGVDHSEAAVEYARGLQAEFQVRNAEFQRGDATALLLEDNSFDFVSCRLSLQIFSQPEQIVRELVRITRPGGRIYITGEDYDLILGHPEQEPIRATYQAAASYGAAMGMDLRNGRRLSGLLADSRLEDIRADHIVADTVNTEREAFAAVIESWRDFSAFTIGSRLDLSEPDRATLLAGYDAHLRSIRWPQGYASWTVIACSGRKPANP
ncbi:methyltransferase domain-containing protein [Oscillochloris sp. ZM17-4]|uniref:class I SAM-dependent methyltransferase n=1 Tax=Oscillochloris sp. ZM17-4 TaxID=2866714 RepID=UPI001C72B5BC|nr:methyltransferase domain-containing protein [Oscillochloris sp. ZM17-4]MBX0328753.1 methyltransferase domain-containing protein [Oscillochloris sp. ZM17-4]